jgi:hypothetical protein
LAEGLLHHLAGDRFEVESAGTEETRVNPSVIAARRELGIDITSHIRPDHSSFRESGPRPIPRPGDSRRVSVNRRSGAEHVFAEKVAPVVEDV